MSMVEQIAAERGIYYGGMKDPHVREITGGGIAMKYKGKVGIFVDQELPPHTKQFVEVHELAHVVLGHLEGDMDDEQRQRAEREADMFAVVFLALEAAGLVSGEAEV